MRQQKSRVWPALFAGLVGTAAAMAQAPPAQSQPSAQAQPAPPGAANTGPVHFSLSVRGDLAFNTNLSDLPGDVTVSRVGGNFGAVISVGDRSRLTLGFDYEHSNYDFHDATGFTSGSDSPFNEINRETLSGNFYHQQTEQLGWLVGGSFVVAAEDGADLGRSLEGTVYGGVRYAITKNLRVGGGIYVGVPIEDNAYVWPLITLDWQINKQWSLSTEGRPGLTLSYALSDRWTLFAAAEYQYRDFRLDRHGPAPSGVGRDTRLPLMIGARFNANDQISFEGGLGAYFFQNLEVDNSGGNKLADSDLDAAPFVELKLNFRF